MEDYELKYINSLEIAQFSLNILKTKYVPQKYENTQKIF